MSKKTHKILIALAVFVTVLICAVIILVINPTDHPKITETKERFLPFGQPTPPSDTVVEPTPTENEPLLDDPIAVTQKLMRLVEGPVAGAVAFTKDGETMIRYTEQKTGDIYNYSLKNKTSERIFQQTLLGIHTALWSNDGENTILRFLKNENDQTVVKTYAISLEQILSGSTTDPFGRFLPDNLLEVVISPDAKNVVYLQKEGGNAFVLLETLSGDQEREQIFTSSFTEWLMEYPKEELLTLTTKPSYNIDGYLYFVDTQNGTMKKVLGGIKGLTTLTNPNATKVLYSKSAKNSHSLAVYDIETGIKTDLELNTLPEKCVWGSDENTNLLYCAVSNFTDNTNLPDKWYKGEISFSDDIWIINTETRKSGIAAEIKKFNKNGIDVIKPFLGSDNKHLLFTNKKDGALWILELETIEMKTYE